MSLSSILSERELGTGRRSTSDIYKLLGFGGSSSSDESNSKLMSRIESGSVTTSSSDSVFPRWSLGPGHSEICLEEDKKGDLFCREGGTSQRAYTAVFSLPWVAKSKLVVWMQSAALGEQLVGVSSSEDYFLQLRSVMNLNLTGSFLIINKFNK